jgi:hypothetical protein
VAGADDRSSYAVNKLVSCLTRSNMTFFLGSAAGRVGPDMESVAPRPYVISRNLLSKLGLVSLDWQNIMPPPDVVATYYAVKHGPESLESAVAAMVRTSGVPDVHVEFARLIEALNAWRKRNQNEQTIQEPLLIVTTALDVRLERAFLEAEIPFSRVVQHQGEAKLSVNSYVPRRVDGTLRVGPPAAKSDDDASPPPQFFKRDAQDERWLARAIAKCGYLEVTVLEETEPGAKGGTAASGRPGGVGGLGGLNPIQTFKVSALQQPVIYKLRGSEDVATSCAIATDQYLDLLLSLTRYSLIPEEIRQSIRKNPTLVLGHGFLDPDFRLAFFLFREELRHRDSKNSSPRFLLQQAPAEEATDIYRQMERDMWLQIKESGRDLTTIATIEESAEAFLQKLTAAINVSD